MEAPETRFVVAPDGARLAYQVIGGGAPDVLFVPNWGTNVDALWQLGWAADFWRRLASMGRLIVFDARGSGASDSSATEVPTFEQAVGDIRTVMTAAGSDQAVLIGIETGAAVTCAFAAAHHQSVAGIVLYAGSASILDRGDGIGIPESARGAAVDSVVRGWGRDDSASIRLAAPGGSREADRAAMARTQRLALTPATVRAFVETAFDADIRHLLPAITTPALVLHRVGDRVLPIEHGRYLAQHLANATMVELDGDEHSLALGDADEALDRIEHFVTGLEPRGRQGTHLAILFTDIVGSTQLAAELGDAAWRRVLRDHNGLVRNEIVRLRGTTVKSTGDGFLATFDDVAAAVECAWVVRGAVRQLGVEVRCGVHFGEVHAVGTDISGLAVHVAQRVCASSGASEVTLTSEALGELGDDVAATDRGDHGLRGVPGLRRLYAVEPRG